MKLETLKVISVALLAASGIISSAQEEPVVAIEDEPHHRIVFRNDYVRVIDATFPPGYVTLNHRHETDNVAVMISPGREGAAAVRGVGRASFSKGGYSHSVTNPGPGIMRFIAVEIFGSDRPRAEAPLLPNHMLELENERVRIYRVRLEAGAGQASHTHPSGWMEITISGRSGAGAYAWLNGGQDDPLLAEGGSLEIVEIQPK